MNKSPQSPKSIPPWVYWMPPLDPSEPRDEVEDWARQVVGVVRARKGAKLDLDSYLFSLSRRVQELLNKAPDPQGALDYFYWEMESEDRSPEKEPDLEEAGLSLIYHNPRLWSRLNDLVPEDELLPVRLGWNNPEAENLYKEVDIENFHSALTGDLGSDHLF